jgi:transcriptional regulator with XRE-family HTH domain
MKLSSDAPLAIELSDAEIRQHTIGSQIKIGIPFQLRAMREHREWTQEVLAEKIGTTQNTISRLENPKTAKPSITTLLRLAHAFDVGLLVRFVPFGFYGDVINATNATHIEVPSYDEELHEELAALEESNKQLAPGKGAEVVSDPTLAGILGIAARQGGVVIEMPRREWGAASQTQIRKQSAQELSSVLGSPLAAAAESGMLAQAGGQ